MMRGMAQLEHESNLPQAAPVVPEATLREVIETLAPIDRTPCSGGERAAAEWIAERWRAAGAQDVAIEDEPSWGTFPKNFIYVGILGMIGALVSLAGRRWLGALIGVVSTAGVIDEVQNGPRLLRRALRPQLHTTNVVARIGDRSAGRKLLIHAHHDAAQQGVIFDQSGLKKLHQLAPGLLAGIKTGPPQWWIGVAPGYLGLLGAITRRRWPVLGALTLAGIGTALVADIERNDTVPGASDNLSGVAALTALAELLSTQPLDGVEVWLVSCGAEETLQDGIRAFMTRHQAELDPAQTWALNIDTVGSNNLVMVEAEGPIWMEEFAGAAFREVVADCAQASGIALERGLRARGSSDSVITHRYGLPTAFIGSLTDWRVPANYHLKTDTPGRVDYGSVAAATRIAWSVASAASARA